MLFVCSVACLFLYKHLWAALRKYHTDQSRRSNVCDGHMFYSTFRGRPILYPPPAQRK